MAPVTLCVSKRPAAFPRLLITQLRRSPEVARNFKETILLTHYVNIWHTIRCLVCYSLWNRAGEAEGVPRAPLLHTPLSPSARVEPDESTLKVDSCSNLLRTSYYVCTEDPRFWVSLPTHRQLASSPPAMTKSTVNTPTLYSKL